MLATLAFAEIHAIFNSGDQAPVDVKLVVNNSGLVDEATAEIIQRVVDLLHREAGNGSEN